MIFKYIRILGGFFILTLLAGCEGTVPYNANLFRANPDNCWPCQMYMEAFKAMDKVLDGSLEKIATNSLIVLEIGLLFWFLFKVMTLLLSFSTPDMNKEFASFVTILFKAAIVALFLNNPQYIYDFFGNVIIQPLGQGFLSLSDTVLATPTQMGIDLTTYDLSGFLNNLTEALTGKRFNSSPTTSQMFGELAVSVYQIVFKIYAALWSGVGLGFQLWNMQGLSAAVAGFILIGGMMWLVIMMPLSFVDAFIRIGLILILLPLLLVGWVFSYPKDIVKKLFHNLLAGFFDILFTCIYISFLISMFLVYESTEIPGMLSSSIQTTEGAARTVANNFGTEFLILTILTWVMVSLSNKIQDFSSYFFASAGKSNIFDTVNKLKNLAMKGVRIVAAVASGPLGWAVGAAKAVKSSVQQAAGEQNQSDSEKDSGDQNESGENTQNNNSQKAASKRSAPPQKKGDK